MHSNGYDIKIDIPDRHFEPGEFVKGKVNWQLDKPPESIILHIGWYTEGRGSEDSCIEFEQKWQTQFLTGMEAFSFQLPPAPYSFEGKLIELIWYVSAESQKGGFHNRIDLVVGPDKKVVKLA